MGRGRVMQFLLLYTIIIVTITITTHIMERGGAIRVKGRGLIGWGWGRG